MRDDIILAGILASMELSRYYGDAEAAAKNAVRYFKAIKKELKKEALDD